MKGQTEFYYMILLSFAINFIAVKVAARLINEQQYDYEKKSR